MHFEIPHDDPCLAGHFPGRPLVPGVVLLERVLAAIEAGGAIAGPLRLPQVKFVQPLLPDEVAEIALETTTTEAGPRWRFRVERDGVLLASGDVIATGGDVA